jgi:hypothetical protein
MPVTRTALGQYLRARRGSLKPEDVGYPSDANRRVQLAGISLEYYVRLEQGRDHQISEQVLSSLSRALKLDENGRTYLYRLALPSPRTAPAGPGPSSVSETVLQLLEQWSSTPAYIFDRNQDILVANDLAAALSPGYVIPGNNLTLMLFDADSSVRANGYWRATARASVAALRFNGDPDDPRLQEIVGTLSVRDQEFRRMWADHEVHPLVGGVSSSFVEGYGPIELRWQILDVPDGNYMNVRLADPDSHAEAALRHLAAEIRSGARAVPVESVFGVDRAQRAAAS